MSIKIQNSAINHLARLCLDSTSIQLRKTVTSHTNELGVIENPYGFACAVSHFLAVHLKECELFLDSDDYFTIHDAINSVLFPIEGAKRLTIIENFN